MGALNKDEKKELVSILEWYLEDETDKEQKKFIKGIIEKLEDK